MSKLLSKYAHVLNITSVTDLPHHSPLLYLFIYFLFLHLHPSPLCLPLLPQICTHTLTLICKLLSFSPFRLQVKCDQYWPTRGTETYGLIQVTLLDTVELATYSVRTFALYKVKCSVW